MSENPAERPSTSTAAADTAAYYAAAATLVASVLLPWCRFDVGEVFAGSSGGASMQPLGDMLQSMMSGVDGAAVKGFRLTEGKLALAGAVVAGGVPLAAALGLMRWPARVVLPVSCVGAMLAAGAVLYAMFDLGGPLSRSIGLYLALVAAAALVYLAARRLQAANAAPAAG